MNTPHLTSSAKFLRWLLVGLSAFTFSLQAQIGARWRLQTPTPWADSLRGVVVQNGRITAAGNGTGIVQSTDGGTTWSARRLNEQAPFNYTSGIAWNGVTGAGSMLLSFTDDGLWTSSVDGVWSRVTTNLANPQGIMHLIRAGTKWAAITRGQVQGQQAYDLHTSSDGVTWSKLGSVPQSADLFIHSVLWTGTGYVLGGSHAANPGDNSNAFLMGTTDGTAWTTSELTSSGDPDSITSLTIIGSTWVAVGGDKCYKSTNQGATWTRSTIGTNVSSVVSTGSRLIAVGHTTRAFSTNQGTTWTTGSDTTLYYPNALTWDATSAKAIAVGDGGTIASSSDGVTWTKLAPQLPASASLNDAFTTVAANTTGTLVAANNQGYLYASTNGGTTWTPNAVPGSRMNALAWDSAHSVFIAVGEDGVIQTSANGTAWTSSSSPFTGEVLYGVAASGGTVVAVGDDGGQNGIIHVSTDGGSNWSTIVPGFFQPVLRTVIRGGALWVAMGDAGTVFTSTNGLAWTQRLLGLNAEPLDFRSVAHNGSLFVAVGGGDYGSFNYYTSPNGTTWTKRSLNTFLSCSAVIWTGSLFVIGSDNMQTPLRTSPNGLAWTNAVSPTANTIYAFALDSSHSQLVAVGGNSVVITSDAVPEASFTTESEAVLENAGSMPVLVTMNPAPASAVSIPFTVSGTATGSGTDYTISGSTVTFNAGETSKVINVTLTSDAAVESPESVVLTLGTTTGMRLGSNVTHQVVIVDDDGPPAVQFASPGAALKEHDGSVTARLVLSWPAPGAVSVPLTLSGSATSGIDFTIASTSVSFAAGEFSKLVTLTITDDSDIETDETAVLTIGSPTGATAGAQTTFTTTIQDNDPASTPARRWTRLLPGTGSGEMAGIATNGTRSVIVGSGGMVLTSDDAGASWTPRTTGTRGYYNRVTVSGSGFLAVGDGGRVMTSPDGVQWTEQMVPGAGSVYFLSCTTEGLRKVITGYEYGSSGSRPVIYQSTDLIHWNRCQVPGTREGEGQAVVWTGSQYIMVASHYDYNADVSSSTFYQSADGVNWVLLNPAGAPAAFIENLIWAGDKLIAFNYSTKAYTSPDGVTWTARTLGSKVISAGVATGGTAVLAVGNAIAASTNGTTWTQRASGTTVTLNDVVKATGGFIAIGGDHTIMTSPDGVAWTARTSSPDSWTALRSVIWAGSQFVAIGNGSTLTAYTSPDGSVWTRRNTTLTKNVNHLAWSGTVLVGVGINGTIVTSPDGTTWTTRTSGTLRDLVSVVWSGSQFVAVGGNDYEGSGRTAGAVVLTSPNGITWTSRPIPTVKPLQDIVFTGSQYVAVGHYYVGFGPPDYSYADGDAVVLTSPNAIDWTVQTTGITDKIMISVVWNGTQLVSALSGYNGGPLLGFAYSNDGTTWTQATQVPAIPNASMDFALNRGCWDGTEFVFGAEGGRVFTSADGNVWALRDTESTQNLLALAWNGRTLVATSYADTIQTSGPGGTLVTPTVQFEYGGSTVTENAGTASIAVVMSDPPSVKTTVPYTLTAQGGLTLTGTTADVTVPASPLIFYPGETRKYLTIAIKEDVRDDDGESLLITLTAPAAGATLGTATTHTLTITDNDTTPVVTAPAAQLVRVGYPINLRVNVTVGTAPLTYAWKLNGKAVTGATGPLLYIPSAAPANGGAYTCTVTNPTGSATATIQVGVYDPTNVVKFAPGTADLVLTSSAKGNLTWSWTLDGNPITPAQPAYTFSPSLNAVTIKKPFTTGGVFVSTISITGFPAAGTATADSFTVGVATAAPALTTLPATLPAATIGTFYNVSLASYLTGGGTWSAVNLPAGLSLNANTGAITGYPTTVGTKSVTIKATNNKGVISKAASLTVNAIPSALIGTSTGLIERGPANTSLGGGITLTVNADGTFTGSYVFGTATRQSFKGNALATSATTATGTTSFALGSNRVTVAFNFDSALPTRTLSGTVQIGAGDDPAPPVLNFTAVRPVKTTPLASFVGKHNFALDLNAAEEGDLNYPQGIGFGTATVTTAGAVTCAGRTGDGQAYTASTLVGENGECPFYAGLNGGRGSLMSWPKITPAGTAPAFADTTIAAAPTDTSWNKNPDLSTTGAYTYANGWAPITLKLSGKRYTAPKTGEIVMGLTYNFMENTDIHFSYANLTSIDGIDNTLAIKTGGAVDKPIDNPNAISLTITPSTGAFKGTISFTNFVNSVMIKRTAIAYEGLIIPGRTTNTLPDQGVGFLMLPQLPDGTVSPMPSMKVSQIMSGRVILAPMP